MKKSLSTLLSVSVPLGLLGWGIYYAPEWTWQFAYNLSLPLGVIAVLGTLACAGTIKNTYKEMKGVNRASSDYATYDWRIWTCINAILILGALWVISKAIPSPDFKKETITQTKYVTRTVEKPVLRYAGARIVYHMPTYLGAYEMCRKSMTGDDSRIRLDRDDVALCHRQAEIASLPPSSIRTITVTKIVKPPYDQVKDRYEACLDRWKDYKWEYSNPILDIMGKCKTYANGG